MSKLSSLPTPVEPDITLEPVTLRFFPNPNHKARCNNCEWESYDYAQKEEAEDAGYQHAERCCERINLELAMQVAVEPVEAQDLAHGSLILLRSLSTMLVENVDTFDDDVMITYSIDGQESQVLTVAVGHIVKVLM